MRRSLKTNENEKIQLGIDSKMTSGYIKKSEPVGHQTGIACKIQVLPYKCIGEISSIPNPIQKTQNRNL